MARVIFERKLLLLLLLLRAHKRIVHDGRHQGGGGDERHHHRVTSFVHSFKLRSRLDTNLPTPRAAGRTMEAVGAVKLDLETWKKNSAVDLLDRCLCRRSGGGGYLLKSTVAYQHRRRVDDAAGNSCRVK